MATRPRPYRFSVAEYDRMVAAGVFPEDARLELIDGEIIEMTPIGPRHARCVWYLQRAFDRLEDDGRVVIHIQNPIHLKGDYEPQPDVVLLRHRAEGYDELPAPDDVLLLVEVADSSLDYDRRKALFYADSGIPEYWLVNVASDPATVTVYRDPQPDGYRSIQVIRSGDALAPLAFPDAAVDTERLLR